MASTPAMMRSRRISRSSVLPALLPSLRISASSATLSPGVLCPRIALASGEVTPVASSHLAAVHCSASMGRFRASSEVRSSAYNSRNSASSSTPLLFMSKRLSITSASAESVGMPRMLRAWNISTLSKVPLPSMSNRWKTSSTMSLSSVASAVAMEPRTSHEGRDHELWSARWTPAKCGCGHWTVPVKMYRCTVPVISCFLTIRRGLAIWRDAAAYG